MKKERWSKVGLPDLFLVGFVCLKIAGAIDWSWWWVTAPLWGSVIIAVLVAYARNW